MLAGPELRTFFGAVSGMRLGPATEPSIVAMKKGDFLRRHTDRLGNRRLAFILYLSRDWSPSYGGMLHITDRSGNVIQIAIEYNSLVIFDVTAHKWII